MVINDGSWIVVGEHVNAWGEAVPVGLPLADLSTHTCVVGTTGSGKSTFLRGLAKQVFDLGGVVIVIEPHGDLILDPDEGILADLPPDRLDRVAVLDFAGPCPPALNLAALDLPRGRAVAVDTAMACIEVVEAVGWEGGVRLREILEHTLHLMLELQQGQASMLDVQRFLMDERQRQKMMDEATTRGLEGELGESLPYLRQLISLLENPKSKFTLDPPLQYPLRRVGRFFRSDALRRSLALPDLTPGPVLDMASLMNRRDGTLILVPLQARNLGHDAKRVIATLLLQTIANVFLARADLPRAARPQTLVIVDEFADLAGTGVGLVIQTLLAQARKYGAAVVLSAQSLAQLPREVQTEVRINTNNKIILRPADAEDARAALANLGTTLLKEHDLLNVERWCGYARVVVQGDIQPPFYFNALPPMPLLTRQRTSVVIRPSPPVLTTSEALAHWHTQFAVPSAARIQAFKQLMHMEAGAFEALVAAQVAYQQTEMQRLLAHPDCAPNPVQRALRISNAQWGLPWWLREAQYRRLRFQPT